MTEPLKLALTDYRTIMGLCAAAGVAETEDDKIQILAALTMMLGPEHGIRAIRVAARTLEACRDGVDVAHHTDLAEAIAFCVVSLLVPDLGEETRGALINTLVGILFQDSGLERDDFLALVSSPGSWEVKFKEEG